MTTQITGVLFDLDGTLADTAIDLVAALNMSLNDNGYTPEPLEKMRHAASHGSMALVNAAKPNLSDEDKLRLQQGLLAHYVSVNGQHCQLFEGIAQVLTYLDAHNIPYGIVTNKPARFTRPLLHALGITANMMSIISGDSTRFAKPHTAPMLLAAQQLKCVPAQILYVGDAMRDLEAANAANMLGGIALWGYLSEQDTPDLWPHQVQLRAPTDIVSFISARNAGKTTI